jgi:hypothetical protein
VRLVPGFALGGTGRTGQTKRVLPQILVQGREVTTFVILSTESALVCNSTKIHLYKELEVDNDTNLRSESRQ